MEKNDLIRLDVDGGKYTYVQRADGSIYALRYSGHWIDDLSVPGANMFLSMAYELEDARAILKMILDTKWDTMTQGCDLAAKAKSEARRFLGLPK